MLSEKYGPMALPFDATMKDLLRYTADWLRQLRVDVRGPVEEIEADLSTVSARELAERLLQGVQEMKESVTYQAILEQGMEKGIERGRHEGIVLVLLQLASSRFGPPAEATRAALDSVTDVSRLLRMTARLSEVGGWGELLAIE